MKINNIIFWTLISILIVGCTQTININNEITKFHRHTSNGIYLKIPKEFIKKKRAGLFQSGHESSISTKLTSDGFNELMKLYSDGVEFKMVEIDGFEKAFYAKALNKKNQTFNYALVLNRNDSTILVKAFCPVKLEEKYDEKITRSIHSIAIGPKINEEIFVKAKDLWDRKVYTKDGNYPTNNVDGATIEKFQMGGFDRQAFLDGYGNQVFNSLFASRKVELNCIEAKKSDYAEGKSFECTIEKDGIYYYVSMIFNRLDENEATIYYCKGNQQINVNEFKSFISKISITF